MIDKKHKSLITLESIEKCLNNWMATFGAIDVHNKNPYRAIAECYLLMIDAEVEVNEY